MQSRISEGQAVIAIVMVVPLNGTTREIACTSLVEINDLSIR